MSDIEHGGVERPPEEDPPHVDMVVGPGRTEDNRRFGRLLADLREAAGLSRSEAANALEVSSEYLRLIELGRRTPAMAQMRAFLSVYKVVGELGKLQPGGDRPDLILLPPSTDQPVTIDFASRIRELGRRGFRARRAQEDLEGNLADEMVLPRLTSEDRATELGHIVTLLVRSDGATLEKVYDLLLELHAQ